jgi:hypothetical protein
MRVLKSDLGQVGRDKVDRHPGSSVVELDQGGERGLGQLGVCTMPSFLSRGGRGLSRSIWYWGPYARHFRSLICEFFSSPVGSGIYLSFWF